MGDRVRGGRLGAAVVAVVAGVLGCGLLVTPAAGAAAAPSTSSDVSPSAIRKPARAPAPWANPSRAVRGERVVLRGRLGSRAGRTVRLLRATPAGWRRAATGTTRKRGAYRFVVTASTPRSTYRVRAPRDGRLRAVTTRPVLLRPWTGADYWFLDDMCRGERPGDAEPYCRRRDDVLKRIGAVNAHGFARAWQRRDEPTMRRLATNQSAVDVALTIRLRRAAPDCEHDASFPSWWCSVQATDGRWTGARSEVVRYERPGLPLWRVVAAGSPDV